MTEKKRPERRKHCALAVVRRSQKFSPSRTHPSRGLKNSQNLISWRWSLPSPTVMGVGKIGDFRRKSPFISEKVRY